jgi:transposase
MVGLEQSKKRALKKKASIYFMDESAFYLLPSVVRTWARKGETPCLKTPCKCEHLSVAGALTLSGRVLVKIQEEAFTGKDSVAEKFFGVEFLKHILREITGHVIVIWDGAKIHQGEAVKSFLSSGGAHRLRLIRLPAYAPELNPSEGLWCWLKDELGNVCCPALEGLKEERVLAIARLRRRSDVLEGCFRRAGLQI